MKTCFIESLISRKSSKTDDLISVLSPWMWSPCTRAAWPPSVSPDCCRSSDSVSSCPRGRGSAPRPGPPAPPWGRPGPAQPHCPPCEDESKNRDEDILSKKFNANFYLKSHLDDYFLPGREYGPQLDAAPGICLVCVVSLSRLQSSPADTRSHLVSITRVLRLQVLYNSLIWFSKWGQTLEKKNRI